MLPDAEQSGIAQGDIVVLRGVREAVRSGATSIEAEVIGEAGRRTLKLDMPLTDDERRILLAGCLINYYKEG